MGIGGDLSRAAFREESVRYDGVEQTAWSFGIVSFKIVVRTN